MMNHSILQEADQKCDYCHRLHDKELQHYRHERSRIKVCAHCYRFLTEPAPDLNALIDAVLS